MTAFESLTLSRTSARQVHRVTFWSDGVGRWDGISGIRMGAWETRIPGDLSRLIQPLVEEVTSGSQSRLTETEWALGVVDDLGRQSTFRVDSTPAYDRCWRLAMALEGAASACSWSPLDTREGADWSAWGDATLMTMSQARVNASGLARPEGLILLAGSIGSTSTAASLEKPYMRARNQLEQEGVLQLFGDSFVVTQHLYFKAPSAAASVLAGANTNGQVAWKGLAGRPWSLLGLGS